jgi:hypothetical protein
MRRMSGKRFMWCVIFAATYLAICVSTAAEPSAQKNGPRLEDQPDDMSIENRFDEVYQQAIASANPQERVILEKEHARWLLERETLKDDPDTYLAYTEQEIRYFAGTYDEPGGVLTFNDLSADEQALYDKGAIMEMYEPTERASQLLQWCDDHA